MEPILMSILTSFGVGMASTITWDLMKSAGKGLLDSFKKRFANKKTFNDDSSAENFFKDIVQEKAYDTSKPLKYAEDLYRGRTGHQNSQEFINEFEKWLKENQKQFSDLVMKNVQTGNQTTNKNAKIKVSGNNNNIGNIHN